VTATVGVNPTHHVRQWRLVAAVVVLALALLPATSASPYVLHVTVLVFVYVMLSFGLSVVVGLAGLLDLGYVAFYAVGAYSYALLNVSFNIPFLVALPIGGVLAALFALVIGWPTIRTRGDYLALVTLGFGEMVRLVLRNSNATNGPRGLMGIDPPTFATLSATTPAAYFYVALALATATVWFYRTLSSSRAGLQLAAIRDDEDAAAVIGVRPVRWKLYAFGVGAFIAGMAGVFFASWQRFVSPESFTLNESILVLSIVVIGGMGRILPTLLAATVMVLLPELLRGFQTARLLVMGIALVAVILIDARLRERRTQSVSDVRQLPPPVIAIERLALEPTERGTSGTTEILRVRSVAKSFGGVRAIEDVSFVLRDAEIIGLVGVNGAGKSTLLQCLTGPMRPDRGAIELLDGAIFRDLPDLTVPQHARLGIVRTHAQPRLFASLSAGNNVLLGDACHAEPTVWEPFTRWSRATDPDEFLLGVHGPRAVENVGQLSFVEQKLVELARAVATRPRILLLDEPAAGMQPEVRLRLARWIAERRIAFRTTIVVVEHDLAFLRAIVDRLLVLDAGRIAADGPPHDPAVEHCIRRVYEAEA
jgi:ABC-type branched-subunit amino acid transport system permease subunit/ABC-type branched-subunit amino acid transport system ATPase component